MLDMATIEHNSEGRPRSAKEIRRILKVAPLITAWRASMPEPRPDYVRPWVIVEAIGKPIEQLVVALRALGWERIQHRETGGVPRIYWLAPGATSPVRAVGRPKGSGSNRMLPGQRTRRRTTLTATERSALTDNTTPTQPTTPTQEATNADA